MKILVVDDERIALEGLVDAIKQVNPSAEIYGFRRARQALEFYKTHLCEVAFLDIQIRNFSGIELAKEVRKINPEVIIIFATGCGDYEKSNIPAFASGYLIKPITVQKIKEELEKLF